jgi:hypothetical protein
MGANLEISSYRTRFYNGGSTKFAASSRIQMHNSLASLKMTGGFMA